MKIIRDKEELKCAVLNKEHVLVKNCKIEKQLKYLAKVKRDKSQIYMLKNSTSCVASASILGGLAGLAIPVAITLILTLGIVSIIAILSYYKITVGPDGIELQPT